MVPPFLALQYVMLHANEKFCANPRCPLNVTTGDPHVVGHGEWATLPNGVMFGRVRCSDKTYCHRCADDPDNPPQFDVIGVQ